MRSEKGGVKEGVERRQKKWVVRSTLTAILVDIVSKSIRGCVSTCEAVRAVFKRRPVCIQNLTVRKIRKRVGDSLTRNPLFTPAPTTYNHGIRRRYRLLSTSPTVPYPQQKQQQQQQDQQQQLQHSLETGTLRPQSALSTPGTSGLQNGATSQPQSATFQHGTSGLNICATSQVNLPTSPDTTTTTNTHNNPHHHHHHHGYHPQHHTHQYQDSGCVVPEFVPTLYNTHQFYEQKREGHSFSELRYEKPWNNKSSCWYNYGTPYGGGGEGHVLVNDGYSTADQQDEGNTHKHRTNAYGNTQTHTAIQNNTGRLSGTYGNTGNATHATHSLTNTYDNTGTETHITHSLKNTYGDAGIETHATHSLTNSYGNTGTETPATHSTDPLSYIYGDSGTETQNFTTEGNLIYINQFQGTKFFGNTETETKKHTVDLTSTDGNTGATTNHTVKLTNNNKTTNTDENYPLTFPDHNITNANTNTHNTLHQQMTNTTEPPFPPPHHNITTTNNTNTLHQQMTNTTEPPFPPPHHNITTTNNNTNTYDALHQQMTNTTEPPFPPPHHNITITNNTNTYDALHQQMTNTGSFEIYQACHCGLFAVHKMPPKCPSIGRQTSDSKRKENKSQRSQREETNRHRATNRRGEENPAERAQRQAADRRAKSAFNPARYIVWLKAAFSYDLTKEYGSKPMITIGRMDNICMHCQAKKWPGEAPGLCCTGGKVVLDAIQNTPDVLKNLLTENSPQGKQFRSKLWKYNAAFMMTSFGADKNLTDYGFFSTFKIPGQYYHKIGSLLPLPEEEPKYVQVYFINTSKEEADRRCVLNDGVDLAIITDIQEMLHTTHPYVRSFKLALEEMEVPDHKVFINADKRPEGEHARRFNAPVANEIGVVLVGEQHGSRDIILKQRDHQLTRIKETHRAYDCLQYPLMFVRGEDGYNFELYQVDPKTKIATNKKVSCKDFYAYHLMERGNTFNHIPRFKQVLSQFLVDMFAKIETERLLYVRLNQKKLRAADYIHLQDAINADGHAQNVGQQVILPSSHIGSPRYMPEQIDDIISAQLPDVEEDKQLYDIIKKNMVHEPRGRHNPKSPCMQDNKCTKKYSRSFVQETQTGLDGYPLYQRLKPQDGGRSFKLKIGHGPEAHEIVVEVDCTGPVDCPVQSTSLENFGGSCEC
ncbi:hypothetical protein Pmani_001335 [Petrolisthes manimaculis]|uniref:Helitron helicase-like domain-containing protein n=1 Tax=Petrolisthes manimaculis TaxID=1843537 RepID=A0AAE1QK60_9EUCA|nr:hypothetical protein Pmani_001335 [Petrolisthes manimaculis]